MDKIIALIEKLGEDIAGASKQIADTKTGILKASQNRVGMQSAR